MANCVKLFISKEELNFLKFSTLVLDEFPKILRQIFVNMWNGKVARKQGFPAWNDSTKVRNMLLVFEGIETAIPTTKSIEDWDSPALFKSTIYSKTFGFPSKMGYTTLNDLYLKKIKPVPGSFHSSVQSPTGNQDETYALTIDQLRLLRNTFCHYSLKPAIAQIDFDHYVQLVKNALSAVNIDTAFVDEISQMREDDFPAEKRQELQECLLRELRAISTMFHESMTLEKPFLSGSFLDKISAQSGGCRDLSDPPRNSQFDNTYDFRWPELLLDSVDDFYLKTMKELHEMKRHDSDVLTPSSKISSQDPSSIPPSQTTKEAPNHTEVQWMKRSIKHNSKLSKLIKILKTEPSEATRIGTYHVCFEDKYSIGKGSDGTEVYVGLSDDGCEVAIKCMNLEKCLQMGNNERKILNFPNVRKEKHIVNYRFYQPVNSKKAYLVLDLHEESLQEYVLTKERSVEQLRKEGPSIIRQILHGVRALHCSNPEILHRDLKPSNILVNIEGEMLLADFGISRTLPQEETTYKSCISGTAGWMAVESLPTDDDDDDASDADIQVRYKKQSDIQVVGMLCYYILTKGKHPYGSRINRLYNISKGNFNLKGVSDTSAKDLIMWMLQHDPHKRPNVHECLKHPYLRAVEENFNFVKQLGNEKEINTKDPGSTVVQELNKVPILTNWLAVIDPYVMAYMAKYRRSPYTNDVADLVRFVRNMTAHWHNQIPPANVKLIVVKPLEYFHGLFPTLSVELHRIIRGHPNWTTRDNLKDFF